MVNHTRQGRKWQRFLFQKIALVRGLLFLLASSFLVQASTLRPSNVGLLQPEMSFYGFNENERIGYYLASAGDVNADGYHDFMVAAYHHYSHGWNCGGVYLFLGAQDRSWRQEESIGHADAIFKGSHSYEMVGYCISGKGDFNGDGFDDLLIGAPGTWETRTPNPGILYIVLGKPQPDWGGDCRLAERADISILGESEDDQFGYAVAFIGDLNGDGCDEVLCGAAFRTENAVHWTGEVYLILGQKDMPGRNLQVREQAIASFIYPYADGNLGYAVAGPGDTNGDAVPDLVLCDQGSGTNFLLFGRPQVDWGWDFPLTQADVIFQKERENDHPGGQARGVGDVNGDGLADFAITGIDVHYAHGKVYLWLGRTHWPAQVVSLRAADASFIGEQYECWNGTSIDGVGDFNGDGLDDFAFGSMYFDSPLEHAGKEYLVLGRKSGWQTDVDAVKLVDYFVGPEKISCLGWGTAGIGDYNGDFRPDFIASAPFNSSHKLEWNGRIFLFQAVYPTLALGGTVRYAESNVAVPEVTLRLSGTDNYWRKTDASGRYRFAVKPDLPYSVHVWKSTETNLAPDYLTAYDAALIARALLGLEKLSSYQQLAADVDQDGQVTLLDAVHILRSLVALPALKTSDVGAWHFMPAARTYPTVTDDQSQENFTGVARGDVDLSWQHTSGTCFAKMTLDQCLQSARVSFGADSTRVLRIRLRPVPSLLALEMRLEYPSEDYLFQNLVLTGAGQNWTPQVHVVSDTLRLALMGTQPINAAEIGLEFHFRAANEKRVDSILKLKQVRLNNLPRFTSDFQIPMTVAHDLSQPFKLDQNYPNPVATETYFPFEIPVAETVSLKIYNLLGQEVWQLLEQPMPAGQHRFHWLQPQLNSARLPAGIYYCRIQAGRHQATRKFIILP
ncbi:T9SS type A sorting domain-containing protein [candidate division KSB1 bacterium]|nr:T9SS type A sorting domain-containing protein [candidate division KSB1 bacterium]